MRCDRHMNERSKNFQLKRRRKTSLTVGTHDTLIKIAQEHTLIAQKLTVGTLNTVFRVAEVSVIFTNPAPLHKIAITNVCLHFEQRTNKKMSFPSLYIFSPTSIYFYF